jgi:hypothetical protein
MPSPVVATAERLPTNLDQSSQYDEDSPGSADENSPSNDVGDESTHKPQPLQKRRRVTRACDECRRKKIKCDGKQPCTHCTIYSYGMSTRDNLEISQCVLTCATEW